MSSAGWRYQFTARAKRDFKRLDPLAQRRVLVALDRLIGEPPAGDVVRLAGTEEWRLRVGDWRVRFERDRGERIIYVLRVLPRGKAYRDL